MDSCPGGRCPGGICPGVDVRGVDARVVVVWGVDVRIVSKVMEAAINIQLQNYMLHNNLISSRQFGFKPGHSTAELVTVLSQNWNNILDI